MIGHFTLEAWLICFWLPVQSLPHALSALEHGQFLVKTLRFPDTPRGEFRPVLRSTYLVKAVMLLRADTVKKPWLNNVLVVLALLGTFAAFNIVGHRSATYFWPKLVCVLALSAGCLFLTRARESFDTYSAVMAGLLTLCAVAMTTADPTQPNWWPFFLGFSGAAVLFVLLTRNRLAALLAVAAIVGSRLIVFVILRAFHR